jgi:hypothetical protein
MYSNCVIKHVNINNKKQKMFLQSAQLAKDIAYGMVVIAKTDEQQTSVSIDKSNLQHQHVDTVIHMQVREVR